MAGALGSVQQRKTGLRREPWEDVLPRGARSHGAAGPLVAAGGVVYLLARVDESPDSLRDIFPGMTILALGLAIVVAPLTAVVVADADDHIAGVASGVYHAVVRVAGLLATAAVGTIAGGALDVGGLRIALAVTAGLLALGEAVGLCGVRNPSRDIRASIWAGGQLMDAPSAGPDAPSSQARRDHHQPSLLDGTKSRALFFSVTLDSTVSSASLPRC